MKMNILQTVLGLILVVALLPEAKADDQDKLQNFANIWAQLEQRPDSNPKDLELVNNGKKKVDKLVLDNTDTDTEIASNPCAAVRCKLGKECVLNNVNRPKCACIEECPSDVTPEEAVCGSNNKTYTSECSLWRSRCLQSQDKKQRKKVKHLRVKYLGPCKKLTSCKKSELEEYPTRMRSWVKNVFLEMYDLPQEEGGLNEKQRSKGKELYEKRDELQDLEEGSPDKMEGEFDEFYHLYIYPIHWRFAQLDRRPNDQKLSKRELEPLRKPLIPLEHCTKAFFKQADKNNDKHISLQEWGTALGLRGEHIDSNQAF